jgi:hypothetical protein
VSFFPPSSSPPPSRPHALISLCNFLFTFLLGTTFVVDPTTFTFTL